MGKKESGGVKVRRLFYQKSPRQNEFFTEAQKILRTIFLFPVGYKSFLIRNKSYYQFALFLNKGYNCSKEGKGCREEIPLNAH